MKYTIQTKQKNYLSGLEHNSIDEVESAIVFYDLLPPFKVFDEKKQDITEEVVSKLTAKGYKFVDKKKVAENLPSTLQQLMNKYYRNIVTLSNMKKTPIKLVTVKDIKSIDGFYELWDKNAISIGMSGTNVVFYDCKSKNICSISKSSLKDLSQKTVIFESEKEFVKDFKSNVK